MRLIAPRNVVCKRYTLLPGTTEKRRWLLGPLDSELRVAFRGVRLCVYGFDDRAHHFLL